MSFSSVVLPQPLGPSTTIVRALGTRRVRSLIAIVDLRARRHGREPTGSVSVSETSRISICTTVDTPAVPYRGSSPEQTCQRQLLPGSEPRFDPFSPSSKAPRGGAAGLPDLPPRGCACSQGALPKFGARGNLHLE